LLSGTHKKLNSGLSTVGMGLLLTWALCAPQARAGTTVGTFTITGTGIQGSGTITLMTTATPGVSEIIGMTGSFSTTSGGFSGAITGMSPASYNSNSPTIGTFDRYDNLFYPTGSAPGVNGNPAGGVLDDYGLDFMVAGGYTVNLFERGTTVGFLLDDGLTSNVDHRVPVTFVVNETPITLTGAVNAASGIPPGLPNYGIAQGSIFLVYGANIGPSSIQVASQPLPTTAGLGGTSISITVNGTTVAAPMYFALSTQVAAVMPSNAPAGTGVLTLTYNGNSGSSPVTVVPTNFGISNAVVPFADNGVGVGSIAAATFANYQYVTATNTAKPGDTLTLWGTGLGPTPNNGGDTGAAPFGNIGSAPLILVGGVQSPSVTYWGRSPNTIPGLDQIDFVVPDAAPLGCNVGIIVQTMNGTTPIVSNGPTISLAAIDGATCQDPTQRFPPAITESKTSVKALLIGPTQNVSVKLNADGTTTTTTTSGAQALISQFSPAQVAADAASFTSANYVPSLGSCYTGFSSNPSANGNLNSTPLNVGSTITLTPPSGSPLTLAPGGIGYVSNSTSNTLPSGTWTFSNGAGGPDVGPLNFNFTVPAQVDWTNQTTLTGSQIDRTQPLTITWSGGDSNGYVDIQGNAQSGMYVVGFECAAPTAAGEFTIPPSILLGIPPGSGGLQVTTSAIPSSFGAIAGFDATSNQSAFQTSVPVTFK
jgi:uncharacterized protein (TIGR03437 family)